jgi:glycine/D-amino acid oxidase-like deaminating enzyme/nitrite reductase/ring-hydroxylating ferredoxin subunit
MSPDPPSLTGERQRSLWQSTADTLSFPALEGDAEADVCIVGAGIAGLSVAYELTLAGRSVIVLDHSPIGAGMTGRTSAHLSNALDDRYEKLERVLGADAARIAAESHTGAIDRIAVIAATEQIPCSFERVDGYLFAPPGDDSDGLRREYEAARRAGLRVEWVPRAPFPEFETGDALRFPEQGQFHPLRYLTGLAHAIRHRGGRIFTGTHVDRMEGGRAALAVTARGTVSARHLVIATNTPVNNRFIIHTKQAPYTTCVVGLRYPRGTLPLALFWDTRQSAGQEGDAYHYVRTWRDRDGDVLLVGGEDHKTGQHPDIEGAFAALAAWARHRFPGGGDIGWRWTGQVFEPVDGMAFIGRNPHDEDNVYIATGDSGNGLTHGVIAGLVLSSLILGQPHPWAGLYDPRRITVRSAPAFLQENLNVAAQYRDHVTGGDWESADAIPPGSGGIVREGLHKVAVFRDDDGDLHRCSAVCPHLKCIVHWNSVERTWDCPCHGSRFDAMGKVLSGPAISDLEPAVEKPDEPRTPAGSARMMVPA